MDQRDREAWDNAKRAAEAARPVARPGSMSWAATALVVAVALGVIALLHVWPQSEPRGSYVRPIRAVEE